MKKWYIFFITKIQLPYFLLVSLVYNQDLNLVTQDYCNKKKFKIGSIIQEVLPIKI